MFRSLQHKIPQKSPAAEKEHSSVHPGDWVLIGWCMKETQNLLYDCSSTRLILPWLMLAIKAISNIYYYTVATSICPPPTSHLWFSTAPAEVTDVEWLLSVWTTSALRAERSLASAEASSAHCSLKEGLQQRFVWSLIVSYWGSVQLNWSS